MDNTTRQQMLAECKSALNGVLTRYGMVVESKGCRYQEQWVKPDYRFVTVQSDTHGNIYTLTPEWTAYKRHAGRDGKYRELRPTWLGKVFTVYQDKYMLVGLNTRNRIYAVVVRDIETGDLHKVSIKNIVDYA